MNDDWLYRYKRKIIARIVIVLALSMCGAMIITIMLLRDQLIKESSGNSRHIGNAITSSLRTQMLANAPDQIQKTLDDIGADTNIGRIYILNRDGRVMYASNKRDIGKQPDRKSDASCLGCHGSTVAAPATTSLVISGDALRNSVLSSVTPQGGSFSRSVNVIRNEPACYGCHPRDIRINGKIIIDHPLESTNNLIRKIELIILVSGFFGLLLMIPLLSRLINRYIDQIILKKQELSLVYSIINNISKTIDIAELTTIVLDISHEVLSAEEIEIILPKGESFRITTRLQNGEKVTRKKRSTDEPLADIIERWQSGGIPGADVSTDRTEIYLPIEKGEHRLCLIVARNRTVPFAENPVALVEAVCNHFAIAFENARLYSIAITDELTGLFTVRHFRTCLDRQMESFDRYGERFALLVIDIDNFKRVNDTYGHVTGDDVLKHVAGCITEAIASTDLAFRYGGEEFTVLLPSTDRNGAAHVGERIRAQVENSPVTLAGGIVLTTTVSIGFAVCPDDVATIKELMLQADKALYAAKHAGKNRVVSTSPEN